VIPVTNLKLKFESFHIAVWQNGLEVLCVLDGGRGSDVGAELRIDGIPKSPQEGGDGDDKRNHWKSAVLFLLLRHRLLFHRWPNSYWTDASVRIIHNNAACILSVTN
jgi:hypothetical protein